MLTYCVHRATTLRPGVNTQKTAGAGGAAADLDLSPAHLLQCVDIQVSVNGSGTPVCTSPTPVDEVQLS